MDPGEGASQGDRLLDKMMARVAPWPYRLTETLGDENKLLPLACAFYDRDVAVER